MYASPWPSIGVKIADIIAKFWGWLGGSDCLDFRKTHRQSSDFMIYSDRLSVRLNSPIKVLL